MAAPTKLQKASFIALKEFMGLSQDESLLVLSDEGMRDIGLTLFETGKKICSEALYVEMKPREISGQEPPTQIADMMKTVDVVVCPTSKSITHTEARSEASKLGIRIGTMPGITEDTMIRCFSADPLEIIKTTELVASKMNKVSDIRVVTKSGTDILLPVKNRKIIPSTGVLKNIGESGNLPSGEVYLAPWEKKTNGVVVFDGSFAGIGLLNHPITVEIENGYAVNITGKEEAEQLKVLLGRTGAEAFAIGEFGIGTNYKAKLCGHILEDEKVLGTIHIAFGNNLTMGGKISVSSHLDGLVTKPVVYFDDEKIMENGKLLLSQK